MSYLTGKDHTLYLKITIIFENLYYRFKRLFCKRKKEFIQGSINMSLANVHNKYAVFDMIDNSGYNKRYYTGHLSDSYFFAWREWKKRRRYKEIADIIGNGKRKSAQEFSESIKNYF